MLHNYFRNKNNTDRVGMHLIQMENSVYNFSDILTIHINFN